VTNEICTVLKVHCTSLLASITKSFSKIQFFSERYANAQGLK
jgi:hypothetical protein